MADNKQTSDYDSSTDENNPDNHSVHQFCTDAGGCNCHEDADEIALLNAFHQDGLVSDGDADRIFRGKTV